MIYLGVILIIVGVLSIIFAMLATPVDRSFAFKETKLGRRFFSFEFGYKLMILFLLIGIALITTGIIILI